MIDNEVEVYGGSVPNRTQAQTTFNTNISAIFSYIGLSLAPSINVVVGEINAVVAWINTKVSWMTTTSDQVAQDAILATQAKEYCIASANAVEYSSGDTYSKNDVVIASDGNSYRCLIDGTSGDNPTTSITGAWMALTTAPTVVTVETASFNVLQGSEHWVDTSSGPITATLPANPNTGRTVYIGDYAGAWRQNSCTIARNGSKIEGVYENLELDVDYGLLTLKYISSIVGWRIV